MVPVDAEKADVSQGRNCGGPETVFQHARLPNDVAVVREPQRNVEARACDLKRALQDEEGFVSDVALRDDALAADARLDMDGIDETPQGLLRQGLEDGDRTQ